MEIRVDRYLSNSISTLGKLYVNDVFVCYTCEDAYHTKKVAHLTRIPAGTYRVFMMKLGTSRFDASYTTKFASLGKDWYKGMLQLANVPGFSGVDIHIGNSAKDTDGCLLLGLDRLETPDMLGSYGVLNSKGAFEKFYPIVRDVLLKGEIVHITLQDHDAAMSAVVQAIQSS